MLQVAAGRAADRGRDVGLYQRHLPENTFLYQMVEGYSAAITAHLAEQGGELPGNARRELENSPKCGRLEHDFLRIAANRVRPSTWSPSAVKDEACANCGARRMAERAALLVGEMLFEQPMCQWVLSFPFQLRFLTTRRWDIIGQATGIVYRAI